jgi:hypothetical protein
MVLSRKYLPAVFFFFMALVCAALGLLLAFSVPEVGKALNPFITLAIYLLTVLACMLIANGIYLFYLSSSGRPARNLHDAVVQGMLQRWHDHDKRIRAERCEELQDNAEIE